MSKFLRIRSFSISILIKKPRMGVSRIWTLAFNSMHLWKLKSWRCTTLYIYIVRWFCGFAVCNWINRLSTFLYRRFTAIIHIAHLNISLPNEHNFFLLFYYYYSCFTKIEGVSTLSRVMVKFTNKTENITKLSTLGIFSPI